MVHALGQDASGPASECGEARKSLHENRNEIRMVCRPVPNVTHPERQ
jgi:hypothetical protein